MKILVVCDVFPPEFAPRMGYLCKYLTRMDCMVDVITEQYSDDQRFAFIANTSGKIKRICFYRSLKTPKSRLEWGQLLLRDLLFQYKDKRFVAEIKKDKEFSGYDLVLCSTYRTFPLEAAARLSRHFNIPLVVDLRDIIEQYPDQSYLYHRFPCDGLFRKPFTRRLLKKRNKVLAEAAAVVSVSPWHVDFLKTFNSNTHLIYNGYDPEIFFPDYPQDSCFRILFTGRLISPENRNPEWLFEAVSILYRTGRVDKTDFRIEWYCDTATRKHIQKKAKEYGLEDIIDCFNFVSAEKVPQLLQHASILLQLSNVSNQKGPKGIMTTKFFEALAVGKPLLLLPGDQSYLSDIINRYHCGLAANNVEEVKLFIENQYKTWKQKGYTQIEVNPQVHELFSRKAQAGQFLKLFREVVKHD